MGSEKMLDLQRHIEKKYEKAIIGNPAAKTEFGTTYVTICNGAIKPEGEPRKMAASIEKAVMLFTDGFTDDYTHVLSPQEGHQLVWRQTPRLVRDFDPLESRSTYAVTARACVERIPSLVEESNGG